MAIRTAPHPLPLTRDLSLVFKLTDATATLLAASSIAGLLFGPRPSTPRPAATKPSMAMT